MMTTKQSTNESKEEIRKVFHTYDEDASGTIGLRELKRVARELGETVDDEVLQDMIDRISSR